MAGWQSDIGFWVVATRGFALAVGVGLTVASPAAASLRDVDRAISKHLKDGNPDSAVVLVEQALSQAGIEYGDPLTVAAYADSLGVRFFDAYQLEMGVTLLERGMRLRESALAPDDLALADPLEQLSTAYYIVGRLNDAVAPQERAIAIKTAKLGPDDLSVAWSRYLFSLLYYSLARYAEAERELRAALTSYQPRRKTEAVRVAEIERVLGEVCRELNRYDEAEEMMTDATALARDALPARDPQMFVFLNSLAGYYKDQARYDEAEPLIEEALDVVDTEADRATLTLNLAEVSRLQGRYDDAIPLYQRAVTLAQKTMPPSVVAEFYNQLAEAYAEMGRPRNAEEQFRRALAVVDSSRDASPQVVAQFKNDFGVLLARKGRTAEGEALLEEAIALREQVFGANHPLVAVSLTQLGRARAGLLSTPPKRTARETDAAKLLDRALAIFDSTDAEPEGRIDAGIARAQLFYRDKRADRARAAMAKALDDVEAMRPYRGGGGEERIAFVRRYVDAYDRMTQWQVEAGDATAALAYSERRRARVLVDQLTGGGATGAESNDARERLRAEAHDLERQLAKCQAEVRALRSKPRLSKEERAELARVEKQCDGIAADLQRAGERVRAMEKGPAQTALSASASRTNDEVRLVYHIGTEASLMFLVQGTSVRAYPLRASRTESERLGLPEGSVTRAAVAQLLSGYDTAGKPAGLGLSRQLAAPVETATARDALHGRLHAAFVVLVPGEVWSTIRAKSEVVVIPDGPLFAFPFEACVVSNGEQTVFWLDDGPVIRYGPSLATLDALQRRDVATKGSSDVLSVCNPHYAATDARASKTRPAAVTRDVLAPLPGSERETQSVVSAFGKERVVVLCGDDATEAAVSRAIADKSIVHLATHGLVSSARSDLMSSLALTPVASTQPNLRDDGFLHLFEIYDLPVSAELVVLSACESSTGRYVLGEGVMALSRGFLSAGARRVVATQWKVDDDATATLVGDFLARVASAERSHNSVDYARDLRDAKRATRARAEWSHPFYWAAFVVTGAR